MITLRQFVRAVIQPIVAVSLLVTGCADGLAPHPGYPFELRTDQRRYRAGDTVFVTLRNVSGGPASFDPCIRVLVRYAPGQPVVHDTVAFLWYDHLENLPGPEVLACDAVGRPVIQPGGRVVTTFILPAFLIPSTTYYIGVEGLRGAGGEELVDAARATPFFEVGP
jgi:hypothetical protein